MANTILNPSGLAKEQTIKAVAGGSVADCCNPNLFLVHHMVGFQLNGKLDGQL